MERRTVSDDGGRISCQHRATFDLGYPTIDNSLLLPTPRPWHFPCCSAVLRPPFETDWYFFVTVSLYLSAGRAVRFTLLSQFIFHSLQTEGHPALTGTCLHRWTLGS